MVAHSTVVAGWLTALLLALPFTSSAGTAVTSFDNAVLVQVKAEHATSGNTGPQENTADEAGVDAEEWVSYCVKEGKMYTEFMQWVADNAEYSRVMADKWFENSAEWRNLAASALLLSTQPGVNLTADPEGLVKLKASVVEAASSEKADRVLDGVKAWMDGQARRGVLPTDFSEWLQSMYKGASEMAQKWLRNNLEWQGTAAGSLLAVSSASEVAPAGAGTQEMVQQAVQLFDEKTLDGAVASPSPAENAFTAFAEELVETVKQSPAMEMAHANPKQQASGVQDQLKEYFFKGVKSMAENSLAMAREWFESSQEPQKFIPGSSLRLSQRAGDVEVATASVDPSVHIMRESVAKALMIANAKNKGDAQVLGNITRTVNRAALNSFANTVDRGIMRVVHHQVQKNARRIDAAREFANELRSNIKTLSTQYGKEQKLFWDTFDVVKRTTDTAVATSRHWFEKNLHWHSLSPSNMERILKGQKPLQELQDQ